MTISTLSWANTQGASAQQKSRKTEATEQQALLAAQLQQLANASQPSSSGGSTSIPAIEVAGSSRSGLSALLGSSAASGPPPPPPGGESASEFMDNLGSLLSALSSGDTEAASNAADALQSLIDGLLGLRIALVAFECRQPVEQFGDALIFLRGHGMVLP